jgi:hypothetical protein
MPTRQVVAGFGPVGADNRRVIVQEWLAEAFTMWGITAIVVAATVAGGAAGDVRAWAYRVAAALLVALGVLTVLTGARTPLVWFKVPGGHGGRRRVAAGGQCRIGPGGQVCNSADRVSRAAGTRA